MLIDVVLGARLDIKRYKAPKNTMYLIHAISAHTLAVGNNALIVTDELLEDEIGIMDSLRRMIFFHEFDVDVSYQLVYPKPLKTKFLTVGLRSGSAGTFRSLINYELVQTSKTELIIEWFRKGR